MTQWIEKIKAINPICRAMAEFKREAQEMREKVSSHGREAIHKTIIKESKYATTAKN